MYSTMWLPGRSGDASVTNDSALHLKQVDTGQVVNEWLTIDRLLNCASEYWEEHYTLEQLRQLLLAGLMQFWHLRRDDEDEPYLGALLQINVYGKKKVMRILWLGGEHYSGMMDFLWVLELWAAKLGCKDIEVAGRDGFERLLKPYGFEKTHVVLRKRLVNRSGEEH